MLSRRSWLIVAWSSAALAALVVCGHLAGVCYYQHGGQFSPDTFYEQSYKAYVLGPVTIPIYSRESETVVGRYLAANGHLSSDATNVRWFHTGGTRVGWGFFGCSFGSPVVPIASKFDDEFAERLVAWSERRPDLAKVFWPRIIVWVRNNRCTDAAELLALLEYGDDPETVGEIDELFEKAKRMADEEYGAQRPWG